MRQKQGRHACALRFSRVFLCTSLDQSVFSRTLVCGLFKILWFFAGGISKSLSAFSSQLRRTLVGSAAKTVNVCLGAGSRQYCRYTKSPLSITPLKEIWESPPVNENLTSVGFEPTTSGLGLQMLYRLSYEASTGADRGNLGSESRLMYK